MSKTDQRSTAASPADDLVALTMLRERERILACFEMVLDPQKFGAQAVANGVREAHPDPANPRLLSLAWDKVSFRDLVMDEAFGWDDVGEMFRLFMGRLEFGLPWWKDSVVEAYAMGSDNFAPASMGTLENRFKILGGWIYNNKRGQPASNKVWWDLLMSDPPQADTENRYIRICANYEEMQTYLTMNAILIDTNHPTFCKKYARLDANPTDSCITRRHLTLAGFIVADLQSCGPTMLLNGRPTTFRQPGKTAGTIKWLEGEYRPYIFGVVHPEDDGFPEAFLRVLARSPDKFIVISRRESDPPMKLDVLSGASGSAANVAQTRWRQFDGPASASTPPPASARGAWETQRSALNVLYGGDEQKLRGGETARNDGYLAVGFNNKSAAQGRREISMFFHKQFPVRYLLIIGADAHQHIHDLAREVSWAAFTALGLVSGSYEINRYEKASDVLFLKVVRERMAFMPENSFKVRTIT
ncbi:hypothetical protein MKEN_00160600 [Mycena kentingensis (nom. inval.)]|nr:hypothetical protein MKEN_00160600 [Mycena kentingensis (nom. inval.)]